MEKHTNRKLLTDFRKDWEIKYVKGKISPKRNSFIKRCLISTENLVDSLTHPKSLKTTTDVIECAEHLLHFEKVGRNLVVLGCGPSPETILELSAKKFDVVGIDPIEETVIKANSYLDGYGRVEQGTAERIPLEDNSQAIVFMENVLEHVDSVGKSLAECYRILKPGGVLFIRTTNRKRFSFTGINWEYTTRFFNWFPRSVKESYVFVQLHYHPELAGYSSRPAVHWFSYPDLCMYGREAGFGRFYSPYDLMYLQEGSRSILRNWLHRRPWLRAFMVSQMYGDIFMWKRDCPGSQN